MLHQYWLAMAPISPLDVIGENGQRQTLIARLFAPFKLKIFLFDALFVLLFAVYGLWVYNFAQSFLNTAFKTLLGV